MIQKEPTPEEVETPELTLEQEEVPDEICSFINLVVVLFVITILSIIFGVSDEFRNLCGF